jgi:AcrR family transcriptional regulator
MNSEKRPTRKYELKQRAAEMAETRRRITEAAVQLHGTVGPSRTTVSAIAAFAGVQRHTVYRHFPTDADLYGACSAHYFALNPLPAPAPWKAITDPRERLSRALDEVYAFYERTNPMFDNVLRDLELVDALAPTIAPLDDYLGETVEILLAGRRVRGRRRQLVATALRHVLDFHTWRSLTVDGQLTRAEAVELVTPLVDVAARAPSRSGKDRTSA